MDRKPVKQNAATLAPLTGALLIGGALAIGCGGRLAPTQSGETGGAGGSAGTGGGAGKDGTGGSTGGTGATGGDF